MHLWAILTLTAPSAGHALWHGGRDSPLNQGSPSCSRFKIESLPGWAENLPSPWATGWGQAGLAPNGKGDQYFHYIFLAAEHDPSSAPVVVWYNGGPGASSLFGLFVELGPLYLNAESLASSSYHEHGLPELIYNKYSWTKTANLLIVDNPPPIGFSYCEPAGPTADGYSCGDWNDELVANANAKFLENWITAFPEFQKNPLYITGESYAGIYVPTIVRALQRTPASKVNLQGFAVGDGCIGKNVLCGEKAGPFYSIEFLHGHGQLSNSLYRTINRVCTQEELHHGNLSQTCAKATQKVPQEVGGYYGYNLYDECPHVGTFRNTKSHIWWGTRAKSVFGGALNDYPCPSDAMQIWLNRTDVRKALHIPEGASFNSGDNGVGFNYTLTELDVRPIYAHAILNSTLRVLVYNGDTDPGINSFVTQDIYVAYLEKLKVQETQEWRPWTLDGKTRVGGYVVEYAHGKFSYLTIRGSGHMVPEFKPEASLVFLRSFLENKNFPRYNPN